MTKTKLIMMFGIILLTVGCRKDGGRSEELPPPGDGELHLNKETVAFSCDGGEDAVCDIYGVKLYLNEVKSKVGEADEIVHPHGEGMFPYVPYSVVDGGWFRLELEDDGAVLRCRVERNESGEIRKVFVCVTGMPPVESGYFELVQSGVE